MNAIAVKTNARLIQLETDAMNPTFKEGDVVEIEPSGFEGDGLYAIETGKVVQIKRLAWHPQGVSVISDNHLYPSYLVSVHDIKVLGYVKAVCKFL